MVSDLESFSIDDDSGERGRASLERSLSRELEKSGISFRLGDDSGDMSLDEEFIDGMSSMLIDEHDMDEGISSASRQVDAALNSTRSSYTESIEIGRGQSDSSEELLSGSAKKTSQRVSPSDKGSAPVSDFGILYKKPSRRAYSQATPNRPKSLGVITERSFSDLNRPRSPADSRFAGRKQNFLDKNSQTQVPTSFKSSQDLLKSLGLDHNKSDTKQRARRQSRGAAIPRQAFSDEDASIQLPDITGISSLIGGDDPTPFRHNNIGSIPISDDDQAILEALRTMQQRIEHLENKNSEYSNIVSTLENSLRKTKTEYSTATAKIKLLEEQVEHQRRDLVGSITPRDKAKIQQALDIERSRWQEKQSALKQKIESLQQEISLQTIRFARIEEEHKEAVKLLAEALAENEQLKKQNSRLKSTSGRDKSKQPRTAREQILKETKSILKSRGRKVDITTDTDVSIDSDDQSVLSDSAEKVRSNRRSGSTHHRPQPKVRHSKKALSKRRPSSTSTRRRGEVVEDREESDEEYSSETEYSDETEMYRPKVSSKSEYRSKTHENNGHANMLRSEYREIPQSNVNMRRAMDSLSSHNSGSCTVCSRRRSNKYGKDRSTEARPSQAGYQRWFDPDTQWQEENTVRPSMPPVTAVTSVLSQLEDEFRHLKMQYQSQVQRYDSLDPAVSKRKRKALVTRLKEIIEELEGKADQIYALYDVLEAHDATATYRAGHNGLNQEEDITRDLLGRHSWINV